MFKFNVHILELEVQSIVQVKVTSDEDIWGIKMLNLVGAIDSFLMVKIHLSIHV